MKNHISDSIEALRQGMEADFGEAKIVDKLGREFTASQIFMMGVKFALPFGEYKGVEELCGWLESPEGEARVKLDGDALQKVTSLIRESFLGQTTKTGGADDL